MNPTVIQKIIKLVARDEELIKEFKVMPIEKLNAVTNDHRIEVDIFLLRDNH